jgi:hypothetical protein
MSPITSNEPNSIERQIGWLEGRVQSLDDRMTRREAEDAAWRENMTLSMTNNSSTLAEIKLAVSSSNAVLSVVKWFCGVCVVGSIPALGYMVTHPWPFGGHF